MITAIVALLFNPFRGTAASEKFPSIVQDAMVIAIFAFIALLHSPDKLFATSAVGALVVGLALQDTLGNLFAGLALQTEKPFFVGDWVKLGSLEGRVTEVTWRATKIRTKANHFCVIPNTVISKDTLVNYTSPSPLIRLEKKIGFGYEAPPNRVKQVVLATIADVPEILTDPKPDVLLDTYNDFSIDYRCRFWVNDFARTEPIMDSFTTLLYYRLEREGLRIPFPIRDVRMREQSRDETDQSLQADHLRRQFLDRIDLFQTLTDEERMRIAESLLEITFAAGETIIRQGQQGDSMFFIERGRVRVVLEKDGAETQVATLEAGQYVGEMALLTGEKRSATIVAITDVHAYVLRKDDFREVLVAQPMIAERLSAVIAERRASLEDKSQEITAAVRSRRTTDVQASLLKKIQKFFRL